MSLLQYRINHSFSPPQMCSTLQPPRYKSICPNLILQTLCLNLFSPSPRKFSYLSNKLCILVKYQIQRILVKILTHISPTWNTLLYLYKYYPSFKVLFSPILPQSLLLLTVYSKFLRDLLILYSVLCDVICLTFMYSQFSHVDFRFLMISMFFDYVAHSRFI